MKKKINFLVVSSLLLILSCSFNNKANKGKTITELQVYTVDFDTETVIKISCENFNKYFQDEIKKTVIKDSEKLKEFDKIIKSLKNDPRKYFPDVRGKVLIKYSNNTIDTLCISRFGLELNGIAMIYDQRVVRIISLSGG